MADPLKPFRFAAVDEYGILWRLKRNCSLTPRQAGWFFLLLSALSMAVGLFFWLLGAVLVLPFTALELLALACAFVLYARHASDGECIRLEDGRLVIETETAGRTQRTEFAREWVRVAPPTGWGALIEVSAGNRSVSVGRFLRAELRPALAREIRQALLAGQPKNLV